jgi:hypothetical protein
MNLGSAVPREECYRRRDAGPQLQSEINRGAAACAQMAHLFLLEFIA